MFFLLIIVVGLVAWALRLMQEAVSQREFSLMLAGCLVSAAAAAMMTVYFIMGDCVGYLAQAAQHPYVSAPLSSQEWALPVVADEGCGDYATDRPTQRF